MKEQKRVCQKCGGNDIYVGYCGSYLVDNTWTDDGLRCTCRTCGYGWAESCLDKQAKQPKQKAKR